MPEDWEEPRETEEKRRVRLNDLYWYRIERLTKGIIIPYLYSSRRVYGYYRLSRLIYQEVTK